MSELVFRDVRLSLSGRPLLQGVSATVQLSRTTFVVGPSGAGKSVLCRTAVGLLRPDTGEVLLFGQPVHALPERKLLPLRRRVPYLVQGPALLEERTLEDNVALAAPGHDVLRAREALGRVGLGAESARLPREVGPGARKRAALARALVMAPEALVLDEPTTGLDAEAAASVLATLRTLRESGLGALVVSHDYRALEELAEEVLVVVGGRLVFQGTPNDFLRSDLPEVRALTRP